MKVCVKILHKLSPVDIFYTLDRISGYKTCLTSDRHCYQNNLLQGSYNEYGEFWWMWYDHTDTVSDISFESVSILEFVYNQEIPIPIISYTDTFWICIGYISRFITILANFISLQTDTNFFLIKPIPFIGIDIGYTDIIDHW